MRYLAFQSISDGILHVILVMEYSIGDLARYCQEPQLSVGKSDGFMIGEILK